MGELLLLGTTPAPPHRKIGRTARSTVRTVPWRHEADTLTELSRLRNAGHYLLGLEVLDASVSLFDFVLPAGLGEDKLLYLIAGNERHGLSPEVIGLLAGAVHLPMYGGNTSLNVSVALGAAVYGLVGRF